jgi:FG-GAP-like repeat
MKQSKEKCVTIHTNAPTKKSSHSKTIQTAIQLLEPRQYLTGVTLGSPINLATGFFIVSPLAAAIGDVNGDGRADLIVGGTSFGINNLGVFEGNADGSFGTPTLFARVGAPISVATGQFDSAGHTDFLAGSDGTPGDIVIYDNDGFGNFTPDADVLALDSNSAIAVGDFNNDGKNDVLTVSNSASNTNNAMLLLGDGSGGLTAQAPFSLPFGNVSAVAVGDFNGDGNLDFVVANQSANSVSVFLGNGNGTFQSPQTYATGAGPASIAVGNFTGQALANGKPELDIVTANSTAGTVSFLGNNGSGGFNAAVDSPVDGTIFGGGPIEVTAANFTGSATAQDLVVSLSSGSNDAAEVLLGNGDGTFSDGALVAGAGGNGAIAADVNGDGVSDVVLISSSQISTLLGSKAASGSSALMPTILHSSLPNSVVAGVKTKGSVTVNVANTSGAVSLGTTTVSVYASTTGVIDGSSVLLGSITKKNFKIGAHGKAPVAVAIPPLPADLNGAYTLLTKVTDPAGNAADSSAGPALAVAPPSIAFSESLITSTLLAQDVSGTKTSARVRFKVTNNGNILSEGKSDVQLFVSPDGTAADGTLIRDVKMPIVLRPNGGSTFVTLPLLNLPAVGDGNYNVVVQITDPRSDVTQIATGGQYALAAPFVALSETLTTTLGSPLVSGGKVNGSVTLAITNNGNVLSKGPTGIDITASTVSGVLGTTIKMLPQPVRIPPTKTVKVTERITSIPLLDNDNYFLVTQVTDPFAGGISIASSVNPIAIALPFVTLAATLLPVNNVLAGDTLSITNNGNVADLTSITATLGFSFDGEGAEPIGMTKAVLISKRSFKAGQTAKIHLSQWKSILSGLVSGVPYFLTVSITDQSGNNAAAVSPTSFTLK